MSLNRLLPLVAALALIGCASFKEGEKSKEAELRQFARIPGKVSLYVCRENALWVARGVSSAVFVNNESIGTVKPNTFVHAVLEPGKHGVLLRHDGLGGGSGGFITFDGKLEEVKFFWVGVTGKGFGTLTIDKFDTDAEAKACVAGATYSVRTE